MEDPGLNLKKLTLCCPRDRKVPMIFVNQNNKSYIIPKGYIVGRFTALKQDAQYEIDVPERFEKLRGKQ